MTDSTKAAGIATSVLSIFKPTPASHTKFGAVRTLYGADRKLQGLVLDGGGPEHEDGIGGIKEAFGIRGFGGAEGTLEEPRKIGADIRKVCRMPAGIRFTLEGGVSRLTFGVPGNPSVPAEMEDGTIYGAWNYDMFSLAARRDRDGILHRMMLAFDEHDVLLCLGGKKGMMGSEKLAIVILSSLSDDQLRDFEARDRRFLEVRDEYLGLLAEEHGPGLLKKRVLGSPASRGMLAADPAANDIKAA